MRHIRKYITVGVVNTITCSVVDSRLDYCNSILYKITKTNQIATCTEQSCSCSVPNAKMHTRRRSACQLHWLPVSYRIEYKIALIAYNALKFCQPRYLADLLIHQQQVRATRSEGQCRLYQPVPNSQTSSRGFRYTSPSIWNLLPPDLRIMETVPTFKIGLKTYMFLSVYGR